MKLSGRSIYTLCIAVPVLCVTSQPAFALLCTRYSLDHSGFVDIAAAASWYPENLNIPDKNFQEIEGQKSVRSTRFVSYRAGNDRFEREVVYQLLPSRKLLASLRKIGGFKLPGDARYNCNKTPEQVKQSWQ